MLLPKKATYQVLHHMTLIAAFHESRSLGSKFTALGKITKLAYCCSRYWKGCWNQEGRRGLVPPKIFDRLVDPISTVKGKLCLTYSYSPPPPPSNFQTFLLPWLVWMLMTHLLVYSENQFWTLDTKVSKNIDVDFSRKIQVSTIWILPFVQSKLRKCKSEIWVGLSILTTLRSK